MRRQLLWVLVAAISGATGVSVSADSAPVSLISIQLEKKAGDQVQTVDPRHVFDKGDTVRFHLKPSVDAYLYVLDLNTSGKYEVLFPRAETGSDNHIEQGRDYLMPATSDGWFEVTGPAGHERLFFVMSPVALTVGEVQNRAAARPPQGTAPASMKPRCNDGIFKARGECVDVGAGPKTIPPGETLPRQLTQVAPGASRDLTFTKDSTGSVVSSSAPLAGPVVYEFLLAHN